LKEIRIISPLQRIKEPFFSDSGIELFIKRDDLIHPEISGNKWRKLKYNLEEAEKLGKKGLLTFGGAYSNHIYATAAAGKEFGFHTIGVIRGKDASEENPTLSFAKSCGMTLHFIDRDEYRNKNDKDFLEKLKAEFNEPYIIPEGGANIQGVRGCAEIISEIDLSFDYICCPCGTATTLAGLVTGLKGKSKALGFAVLKNGGFLNEEVNKLLNEGQTYKNWSINTDYHFGGYAKADGTLLKFIAELEQKHQIQYEPIYTGKMMYGVYDLVSKGFFKKGERIIAIHTGGLQGLAGLKERE
jgi:1-aminocyclopropane-1-carboxylate deaminase/D-cysteine desulfhydrase-like pyridoxal-dependent ACC family enzyme